MTNYYYGYWCKSGSHRDSTGRNVRYRNGNCYACILGVAPGLFTHNIPFIADNKDALPPPPAHVGLTPEEIAQRDDERRRKHIESVKAWNARNKDKTKEYTEKYRKKPEVMERGRQRQYDYYRSLDEDARKEYRRNQYAQFKARLAAMSEEERAAYREEVKLKNKIRYHSRTPEEHAEYLQKAKEYKKRKKDEHKRKETEGQVTGTGSETMGTQDVC